MPGAASVGTVKGAQKGSVPTMSDPGHLEVSPRMNRILAGLADEDYEMISRRRLR